MKDLPANFRHIRLELAREKGHPEGDRQHGYDIVAPLTDDGHIDAETWKEHRAVCRVRRFRPDEDDAIGLLAHGPGGRWYIDYNSPDARGEEAGYRFQDERFVPGEYVSVREDDGTLHTFQVMAVQDI